MVRMLLCFVFAASVVGVPASVALANGWPPWKSISRGIGMSVPGGAQAGGVVIANRQALTRFPILTLHPGHVGCCEWYQTFDWKHDVVLLVVARTQSEFEISRLTRQGSLLRITIGPRYPGQPAFPSPATLWFAVDVPKRLLGSPLPRRVVVAEVTAFR